MTWDPRSFVDFGAAYSSPTPNQRMGVDFGDEVCMGAATLIEKRGDGTLLVLDSIFLDPSCDEVRAERGKLVEYRKGSRVRDAQATSRRDGS